MKMIIVIYSAAADYDIMSRLKEHGISGYTKLQKVCGEGTETEPKLNTHTWPGDNNMLLIASSDEDANSIINMLGELKKIHVRAGIRGFVMPLTEVV
jgi:nitrogen regulatory protein PII